MKCDNCGSIFDGEESLAHRFPEIPHLAERIEPGGIVPAGDCTECGALVYLEPKAVKLPEHLHKKAEDIYPEEYNTFDGQWMKEMMRFPKGTILQMYRDKGKKLEALEEKVQETIGNTKKLLAEVRAASELQQETISDLMAERDNEHDQLEAVKLERDELKASLGVVLDQVDYTAGACSLATMVGAALPTEVIDKARAALSPS